MTSLFLGAYWQSRKESIAVCSRHSRDFFCKISQLGARLSKWYELGESRKDALRRKARLDDLSYWKGLLSQGRHRTDLGNKVMHDLGFSFGLWNGGPDTAACGVHIHCGDYAGTLTNCLAMDIRIADPSAILPEVLRITADVWQPDWAGVMSKAAMDRRNYNASRPFVDWMTYISDRWLPDPPKLAAPSVVEQVPGGTLIVVQETPPDVDNPEDQRSVRAAKRAIEKLLSIE
jgi:hypothetical protein